MANPLPTLDCSVRIASLEEDLQRRIQELRRDHRAVAAARARVEAALQSGRVYYGINTGFGALAHTRIPEDQLAQLQENLLISHAVGVGPWLPRPLCQLMLLLKIHTLGLGYSGISVPTFERLLDFAERNLIPAVPSRGSVGASGDLAPLAHMALPLIGHGYFWNDEGTEVCAASRILAKEGLSPIRLQPNARRFIAAGIPVAVATDFNPGSAPSYHLPLALTLACVLCGLTPAEALKGATCYAARAIGREHELGSLEPGKKADFIIIDAEDVDHWLYHFRPNAVQATFISGQCIDAHAFAS